MVLTANKLADVSNNCTPIYIVAVYDRRKVVAQLKGLDLAAEILVIS